MGILPNMRNRKLNPSPFTQPPLALKPFHKTWKCLQKITDIILQHKTYLANTSALQHEANIEAFWHTSVNVKLRQRNILLQTVKLLLRRSRRHCRCRSSTTRPQKTTRLIEKETREPAVNATDSSFISRQNSFQGCQYGLLLFLRFVCAQSDPF